MIHAQREIGARVFVRLDRLKPVLHALMRIPSRSGFRFALGRSRASARV